MFTLDVDRTAGRIEVRVDGFLTRADVDRFTDAITEAAHALRLLGRHPTILYDYTDAAIQSQEVVAALQAFAFDNTLASRRVALYSGGRRATLQARRIADAHDKFALFHDRAAALAWLAEG